MSKRAKQFVVSNQSCRRKTSDGFWGHTLAKEQLELSLAVTLHQDCWLFNSFRCLARSSKLATR